MLQLLDMYINHPFKAELKQLTSGDHQLTPTGNIKPKIQLLVNG
jgi:hypothetical protein